MTIDDDTWWRRAVVYQVYIRSFADADGDGIGDISGIRSRLPYLERLGIDAIWITPWYASPMADGGYDVADYRDIDPLFGSLSDADALIAAAHEHGIRVLIDIVPNHTSERHPWFQAALASAPGSPERRRYLFRDGRGPDGSEPPNDWRSVFGGGAWTRVVDAGGVPGQWYVHLFAPEQPDLDWSNPEVRREFESIVRFWLDRGVDGFRIDVANSLIKDPTMPDIGPLVAGAPAPTPGQPPALGPRRGARGLSIVAGDRRRLHASARLRRRDPCREPRATGALPPPRRAAHGLQLRLSARALVAGLAPGGHRHHHRRPRPGRRPGDLGALEPRLPSTRDPVRAARDGAARCGAERTPAGR